MTNADSVSDHLIYRIRKKAKQKHGLTHSEFEPIEEKIYVTAQKQDWDELREAFDWIEQNYELVLDDERQYLDELETSDGLDTVKEPEIDSSMSNGEKLKLQYKLEQQEDNEMLAFADEQIGLQHLHNLQESLHKQTGKLAFVVSKQRSFDGRISLELNEGKMKKYELLTVYKDGDDNRYYKHFGGTNPNKGYSKEEELSKSFYEYKFFSGDKEYVVLSNEKLDTGRVKLHGTKISLNDFTEAGENKKLPIKSDIIFHHSHEKAIEPLTGEEMQEFGDGLTHDDLAEYLLGGWRQPEWFEKLLLANIFVNEENG